MWPLIALTLSVFDSHAKPAVQWQMPDRILINEYQKLIKKIGKNYCSAGEYQKYRKLRRRFLGKGFYIPNIDGARLDRVPIIHNIPLMEKKLGWIKQARKKLKKSRYPHPTRTTRALESSLKKLTDIKKRYRHAQSDQERAKIIQENNRVVKSLKANYENLLKKIPFLLNFDHPVDHLNNRASYEKQRGNKNIYAKSQANEIFFKRQILEDGAMDSNNTRSDKFLRTTLDTVTLKVRSARGLLTEDLRFDLEWSVKQIKRLLKRGRRVHLSRLYAWQKRTQSELAFYKKLVQNDQTRSIATKNTEVVKKSQATKKLKEFVYHQQADVYSFLSQQDEALRALFVLETILSNEAGLATRENYFDRKDIAQVVINRKVHRFYSKLTREDPLFNYLDQKSKEKAPDLPWLNVLFKHREFSFTLPYIPGVVHTFCPDQSLRGQKNRLKNIYLSINQMRHPNMSYKATRYFSRVSMVGKIDMSQVWGRKHEKINESPGLLVKRPRRIASLIKKKKYRYLYFFRDRDNKLYDVINVRNKNYAVSNLDHDPVVYQHRNPHYFTFFREKTNRAKKTGRNKSGR